MTTDSSGDVTLLLAEVRDGTAGAADRLMRRVYDELRAIAANRARGQGSMEPTALVNEAYLKLFAQGKAGEAPAAFENRHHFFWAAAQAMRDILVDDVRRARTAKRGGSAGTIRLSDAADPSSGDGSAKYVDLLALDEALAKLEKLHPLAAKVVMLRFFAGLPRAQVAEELKLSEPAVWREWVFAKVWLLAEIEGNDKGLGGAVSVSPRNPKNV